MRERSVLLCIAQEGRQLYVDEEGSRERSQYGFIATASPKRQLSSTTLLLLLVIKFT